MSDSKIAFQSPQRVIFLVISNGIFTVHACTLASTLRHVSVWSSTKASEVVKGVNKFLMEHICKIKDSFSKSKDCYFLGYQTWHIFGTWQYSFLNLETSFGTEFYSYVRNC